MLISSYIRVCCIINYAGRKRKRRRFLHGTRNTWESYEIQPWYQRLFTSYVILLLLANKISLAQCLNGHMLFHMWSLSSTFDPSNFEVFLKWLIAMVVTLGDD